MSVMAVDTRTDLETSHHISAVRERRRQPRRGVAPVGTAVSYVVTGQTATLPAYPSRRLLTLVTLGFYAVCLGGLAVLIWSVVAGLQPVSVLGFPV